MGLPRLIGLLRLAEQVARLLQHLLMMLDLILLEELEP
jgi:hypothetical protein